MLKYKIIETMPVARFFYKGSHSHPVRRTILITESNQNYLFGYELREGNTVRIAAKAPLKSYRRDKIAKGGNLRLENPLRKLIPTKSTLIRKPLLNILEIGI